MDLNLDLTHYEEIKDAGRDHDCIKRVYMDPYLSNEERDKIKHDIPLILSSKGYIHICDNKYLGTTELCNMNGSKNRWIPIKMTVELDWEKLSPINLR